MYLIKKFVKRALWALNTSSIKFPALNLLALSVFAIFTPRYRSLRIKKNTHIVIEGFPRSANTFAVMAFKEAQKKHIIVAHHFHSPVQITYGIKWNVPTVVLLRNPMDAVKSTIIREPLLSSKMVIERYYYFYTSLLAYSENFVLAPFDVVIRDFGKVIDDVNRKFGTDFLPFEHSEKNVNNVYRRIDEDNKLLTSKNNKEMFVNTVARPTKEREEMKNALSIEMEKLIVMDDYAKAQKVYQLLLDKAG